MTTIFISLSTFTLPKPPPPPAPTPVVPLRPLLSTHYLYQQHHNTTQKYLLFFELNVKFSCFKYFSRCNTIMLKQEPKDAEKTHFIIDIHSLAPSPLIFLFIYWTIPLRGLVLLNIQFNNTASSLTAQSVVQHTIFCP